jgi:acyl-CoA thioesterase I
MFRAHNAQRTLRLVNLGIMAIVFNACISLSLLAAEAKSPVKLVAFGDSLTAGFLLKPEQSFPAQLARALAAKGYAVDVTNAGAYQATPLERFEWAVPRDTEAVILELGANDALRGQSPAEAKANLERIIVRLKERNIAVLLAGMRAPSNWGDDYVRDFDGMYQELATKHGLILFPFFLEGIALKKSMNLDDGLHPNDKGVAVIVENIMPKVEELLREVEQRRGRVQSKS